MSLKKRVYRIYDEMFTWKQKNGKKYFCWRYTLFNLLLHNTLCVFSAWILLFFFLFSFDWGGSVHKQIRIFNKFYNIYYFCSCRQIEIHFCVLCGYLWVERPFASWLVWLIANYSACSAIHRLLAGALQHTHARFECVLTLFFNVIPFSQPCGY